MLHQYRKFTDLKLPQKIYLNYVRENVCNNEKLLGGKTYGN